MLVTHQLNVLKYADNIVVMDEVSIHTQEENSLQWTLQVIGPHHTS